MVPPGERMVHAFSFALVEYTFVIRGGGGRLGGGEILLSDERVL